MLRNQNGFSFYTIISIVLFIFLVLVLALPNFYNLDKGKNEEDCINTMKSLWVATTDYMRENRTDFTGDLDVLKSTRKKSDPKNTYLSSINYCPETRGEKQEYYIYGKYVEDTVNGEVKPNLGVIIVCPNLAKNPKHIIPTSFYENMDPTEMQNYMTEDIDYIDKQTSSNGTRKLEMLNKYIKIWQTDPEALVKRRAYPNALKEMLFPPANPTQVPENNNTPQ